MLKLVVAIFCLVAVAAASKSEVPVSRAKELRAACLKQCPDSCPTDTFNLMESNCKPVCRKENGVDLYDDECEACQIRVLGGDCYDCFGQCFIDMGYPDPEVYEPAVLPVQEARKMRVKCKAHCPNDCPDNMFEIMEANCKRSCRRGSGTAFYDPVCEKCVEEHLGIACYDCFGECFRNNNYYDYKTFEPAMLEVSQAKKMRATCLAECPKSCPSDTFNIMETNCKHICRKGFGVALYDVDCEKCVIDNLGYDCWDCFGQCFRDNKYWDPKLPVNTRVPVEKAKELRSACLGECPDACPKNLFYLMENNCKPVCKNDQGVDLYNIECEKCQKRVTGMSCWKCFGECFRRRGYMDPKMHMPSTLPVDQAKALRAKCLKKCPAACPADTFGLMEQNCKEHCRKPDGVDFYDQACEDCVLTVLGKPCYDCFGDCFNDEFYYDPKVHHASSLTVDQAKQMRATCLAMCPDRCLADTFAKMEGNCKPLCKRNDIVDLYSPECEGCVIRTLGKPCWDCFGECFREQKYFDPKLITETTVSVAVAKDMRAKCLEFCPEACPADLFQRMESNCKPSCRKATGVDFYDDACEACVHKYVGKSCYACFGQCFRDMQYHDPKPAPQSHLSKESAKKLRGGCLKKCPNDCPANAIKRMENNCRPACKQDNGIDFYAEDCEACVIKVLGKACYDCVGYCFVDEGYLDPRIKTTTVVPVPVAKQYRKKCLGQCPEECPKDTFNIMETNCKSKCRVGDGTDFYNKHCEACVIKHLGQACYDCFGVCFREMFYFDLNIPTVSTLPTNEARDLRTKCLKACPAACPADTIARMEGNCKPSCRTEGGIDFFQPACEDCVRVTLGNACYDCFGQCFAVQGYHDPRFIEPIVNSNALTVDAAREMRTKCLKQCPTACPADTIKLMEANCKSKCRYGDVVDLHHQWCDKCVIDTLGRPCWDCFGQCFRENDYFDPRLTGEAKVAGLPAERVRDEL